MRLAILLGLAPLLLLGAAPRDLFAGRVAGPPEPCLELFGSQGVTIAGPHTLVYRFTDRRLWRNEPTGACMPFDSYSTIVTEVHGSQLCKGDPFRIRRVGEPIFPAVCRYGPWVPYDRAPGAHR